MVTATEGCKRRRRWNSESGVVDEDRNGMLDGGSSVAQSLVVAANGCRREDFLGGWKFKWGLFHEKERENEYC